MACCFAIKGNVSETIKYLKKLNNKEYIEMVKIDSYFSKIINDVQFKRFLNKSLKGTI